MSKIYADVLAGRFDIKINEEERNMSGTELICETVKAVLARGDGPAVSLMKEIREATEGNKLALTGKDSEPIQISIKYVD